MIKCYLWGTLMQNRLTFMLRISVIYLNWKTWSKSQHVLKVNPEAISLLLTNSVRSFQNSCALETGLSDFHKMTVTVLKSYLEKKQRKIISYRDFGKFSNNDFRTQLLRDVSTLHLSNDSPSLDLCVDILIRALDIYAPKKKKYLRASSSPFMNL